MWHHHDHTVTLQQEQLKDSDIRIQEKRERVKKIYNLIGKRREMYEYGYKTRKTEKEKKRITHATE